MKWIKRFLTRLHIISPQREKVSVYTLVDNSIHMATETYSDGGIRIIIYFPEYSRTLFSNVRK